MILGCKSISRFFIQEPWNMRGNCKGSAISSHLLRTQRKVSQMILVLVAVVQISCMTTPVTVTSSTTPMHDKKIISNNGKVQGSHRAWSVFGLWMVGRPDIDLAIQEALKKNGGGVSDDTTSIPRYIP